MALSHEFRVGLLAALTATAVAVWSTWWSSAGPSEVETWTLFVPMDDAAGLSVGADVQLAGVTAGRVEDIAVVGQRALLTLAIDETWKLSVDSVAVVRTDGLLGSRFVDLRPGTRDELLGDGDVLVVESVPGELDRILQAAQQATIDIRVVTGELRDMVEDAENREHIERTLAQIDALSLELRQIAAANEGDVDRVIASMRRLSRDLEGYLAETAEGVDVELGKLHTATDTLQVALQNTESVVEKVDRGEGTIGALVNDDRTIWLLNDTLWEANDVIDGIVGAETEVFYLHRYFTGSDPLDEQAFPWGNPSLGGSNNLGILYMPQADYWISAEVNSHTVGVVGFEERLYPDRRAREVVWREDPDVRFSLQLHRRWRDVSVRVGMRESSMGAGLTYYTNDDRMRWEVDVFDFDLGAYPAVASVGIPNLRVGTIWEPIDHVQLTWGSEQVLLGLRYGYFTAYVGAGFHFTDEDAKLLLLALPGLF